MDPNGSPGFNPNLNNSGFTPVLITNQSAQTPTNANRIPTMMNNQPGQTPQNSNRMPSMMNNQSPQSPPAETPVSPQNMTTNTPGVPMFMTQQAPTNNSVNGNPSYSPQLPNSVNRQQQFSMMPGVYPGSPA